MNKIAIISLIGLFASGCMTKIISTPLRIGGSLLNSIPIVGGVADTALDATADLVDIVPL